MHAHQYYCISAKLSPIKNNWRSIAGERERSPTFSQHLFADDRGRLSAIIRNKIIARSLKFKVV